MIYRQLFDSLAAGRKVTAGVIGTGHFATAVVTQSRAIPALDVPVICDTNLAAAQQAYHRAGLSEQDYVIADNRSAALNALDQGKCVIISDAALMMELPVEVIVESTGIPEVAARHAQKAIEHGKHVAMVSKEADVTVGPILKHLADRAGVVYTQVDGDQHGLLISMVQWAWDLGLEVICAGKALDAELVFDATSGMISLNDREVYIEPDDRYLFVPEAPSVSRHYVTKRQDVLKGFGAVAGYDVTEMAIVANATGLQPDVETLHCPPIRIPELPEVLTSDDDGGLLGKRGVIDAVRCLRIPHEAGLGGGVFLVVDCDNDYSRHILLTKGLIGNSAGTTAVIYRPYHLCGVETPISMLVAGLLGQPTAPVDYQQRYDVVAVATEHLKAGGIVGNDHSKSLKALIHPAQRVEAGAPVPLHMASGNRLLRDVPAGTLLTVDMVEAPPDSVLWELRSRQDAGK